jgi:2'-5' RNA ligase
VRLFVAIDLPQPARNQLARAIAGLRETLRAHDLDAAFRWVDPGNLHLTLRFLGNVDDVAAERVFEATRAPLERDRPSLILGGLGTFPPRGRPRVLHAAVEQGAEALRDLRDVVDTRLAPVCQWESDTRPFAPHLTLARARDGARIDPAAFSRLIAAVDWPRVAFNAPAVTVFSSRTLPAGPVYTAEAHAALGDGPD